MKTDPLVTNGLEPGRDGAVGLRPGPDRAALADALNYRWRQVATGFAFFVFGLVGVACGLALFPPVCLSAPDAAAAKRRAQYIVHRWFGLFSRLMRALGLITWEIHGAERLRTRGQLIICNHPTLIDVVLLIGHIPEVDCIVKQALFRNPFTRWPISFAGYISNSTPTQLVADCARTLREGNSLLIFPEGTRSRPGEPIRIPHGTARIALESEAPILPVTITCEPLMLTKHTPFWRVPARPGHYVITVGEPYAAAALRAAAPSTAIAARRLSHHWEAYWSQRTGRAPPAP